MNPKTDIIVLVHNNLPITKGFIKHLFENTENFRLIIVDNGSNTETAEYLRQGLGQWMLIRNDQNLGVIEGRNIGAKHIESDYFMNIDNDQYPQKGWLNQLYNLIGQGFDIVGPEAWRLVPPGKQGSVVMNNKSYSRDYYPYRHCTQKNEKYAYIGCGGMLIKKKVYDDIGLFDDRFSPAYFEDPDFCFRAIQSGYKLGWCHNCNITHLAHQTINGQKLFKKNEQFIRSWKKFQQKWTPYFPEEMTMV